MAALSFDPSSLPVHAISQEPAIAPARLTAANLREVLSHPRAWEPEQSGDNLTLRAAGEMTPAAVLIPIVVRESGLSVLLTQRTEHLNDHAGQVSFPGGRSEPEDGSPIETALRETQEEIGLAPDRIETLGTLPEYRTGTGYRITPVIALVHPPFTLLADPFEVAEVFEVPLAFLMNPVNHQTRRVVLEAGTRMFYTMPYERHFIWGATAGMLRNVYHLLAAQL